MADRRLRQVEALRGFGKTARLREERKGAELPAVERRCHS